MASPFEHDNHISVGGRSVDVDWMTHQLEQKHTDILETVMGYTASTKERTDILSMVQGINAMHRLQHPSENIPQLTFENNSDFPSSWGRDLDLVITDSKGKQQLLYEEMNWKDDNKRDHRIVREHHP